MILENIEFTKPVNNEVSREEQQPVSAQFGLALLHELQTSLGSMMTSSTEGRISVGSRELTGKKEAVEQNRQKNKPKIAQAAARHANGVFPDPRAHFLASYSVYDNTVELEDGSFWRLLVSAEMNQVLSWASNDELVITPSKSSLVGQYQISNRVTGQSVHADLLVGPFDQGIYTHWVVGIDDWLGRVYLENGTYWNVRGLDAHLLSDWAINDTIILGHGANEWIGNHDSILINVNLNHYVYANRGV